MDKDKIKINLNISRSNLIQIAIIVVAGVWVFCISTAISVSVGRRMIAENTVTTAPIVTQAPLLQPENTTVAETTAAQADLTEKLPVGGNIVSAQVTVEDPEWKVKEDESKKVADIVAEVNKQNKKNQAKVPNGKKNIIKAYVEGVNKLKGSTDFSLYKDDKLNVTIDSITGGAMVQGVVDTIARQNQKVPITYNFAGGVDAATGKTPNDAIAPLGRSAKVDESAVSSATASATNDGGYTVSLTLNSELQTYTAPAPNHFTMVEVVDVAPLIPAGGKVNSIDMTYSNTRIDAVFDKENRIVSMKHYLCVENCDISAQVVIPITAKVHGEFTSDYTFTY